MDGSKTPEAGNAARRRQHSDNRDECAAQGEAAWGDEAGDEALADSSPVYVGGPVQPSSGWVVCLDPAMDGDQPGVIPVGDRVRVTSSKAAFDTVVKELGGPKSAKRLVVLGYSGWGPGQLEGEIAAGAGWSEIADSAGDTQTAELVHWLRAGAPAVGVVGVRAIGIAKIAGGFEESGVLHAHLSGWIAADRDRAGVAVIRLVAIVEIALEAFVRG